MNSEVDAPLDGAIEDEILVDERGVDTVEIEVDEEEDSERAGLYLAVLAAFAVPALIVLALFLPSSPVGGALGNNQTETPSTGLDRVDIADDPDNAPGADVRVEVAGAGVAQEGERDQVSTEIGSSASLEADETETGSVASENNDNSVAIVDVAAGAEDQPVVVDDDSTAPQVTDSEDTADTETAPAETTVVPTTTAAPDATTSTPPTTAAPATTTAPTAEAPTTTTEAEPAVEPAEFGRRVEIGRIGETTLQFRFSSQTATSYVATIRSGATTVASSTGNARADQLINETIQGLTPGTDYTVQVTLNGPPVAASPRVAFRTSGGDNIAPPTDNVSVQNLRLAETGSTRFEVRYESNVCANGSFVIREQGGPVVGSNAGQAAGCTTRHLGIPGFWTPALKPNTTYVITVTVEADGAGQGAGNTASRSLVVTTAA